MGPCWIRLKNVCSAQSPHSHCKIEVTCGNPKDVTVVPTSDAPESPPVCTMTLKMKTVVNPKSHKQEIVALSGLCNRKVNLDGDTKVSDEAEATSEFVARGAKHAHACLNTRLLFLLLTPNYSLTHVCGLRLCSRT